MDRGHVDLAAEVSLYVRVKWFWRLKKKAWGWGAVQDLGKAYQNHL